MPTSSPDDQLTIRTAPPNGSRPAPTGMWQAPSVEEMQTLLPQYEIIDILGRGGMGAVYKGRQKSLKRLVAIKILPLGMADDEMKFAERFQNEAQTMAAMNHPAIVAVHDFGETADGLLYFIMEFVDGTDVQKMIQASGRLSGEHALAITAHVCDALAYAHKRGVIHRDIKPANILIDHEGHVKVADFGLAKMSDPSQTSGLTRTNMAMGTPDYVAPEVLTTGMVADHRADIYAVGVMLYQMLTGEVPRGMFKLPSQKGIGTDVRFDDIICKAMEQDRDERYQSAMDVRRALDVIATTPQPKDDGRGIVAVQEDLPQKPQGRSAEGKNPKFETRNSKFESAARHLFPIGGIAAVLGVAAFFVFSGKPKPATESASADSSVIAPAKAPERHDATAETMIDWLNAPPSAAYPWSAEWGLKDGVLTPGAAEPRHQFGVMTDGSVHMRVRLAPGYVAADRTGPQFTLEIRNGAVTGVADKSAQVQFQTYVPDRTCAIVYQEADMKTRQKGPVEILLNGTFSNVNTLPGREVDWVFQVTGDHFTATADGEVVASIHDARVRSGWCTLMAKAGMQITLLETGGITSAQSSAAQTFQGHRYQFVSGNFNWQEAKAEAEKLGGHLTVITSAEENDWAWKTFSSQLPQQPKENRWMRGWWLGASQTEEETSWQWLAHEALTFTNWGRGEPRAAINPPRYLWMADDGSTPARAIWSAQGATLKGGYLVEWDSPVASQDWRPVFTRPEDFGGDNKDVEFRDGAVFFKGRTILASAEPPVGAIRSTLRYFDADRTGSLTIRSTDGARYGEESYGCTAFISAKGASVVVMLRDKTAGITEPQRSTFTLSPAIKEGETFMLELKAEAGKIIVNVNGSETGVVTDIWKTGSRRFGVTPSNTEMTEFRDVAVRMKAD